MMRITKLALCLALIPCSTAFAGQHYYEARSDAMGGAAVASSSQEGAALANPALLGFYANKTDDYVLLLPVLGADGADKDDMIDKFDNLQNSYDGLDAAISANDVNGINQYRALLIGDLQALQNASGYVSAGLGFALALPTKPISMAIFVNTYIDAIGLAAIEQSDIELLSTINALNPPSINDLDSAGIVAAGSTTDIGVAFSMPLSIVNMPMTVGISPKIQRLDAYFYAVSANNFDASDFDDDKYRTDETVFNLDVGIAMQPMEGVTLALAGKNLFSQGVDTLPIDNRRVSYQVEPLVTAGIAYDWSNFTLTTDIDLTEYQRFESLAGTQFWRLGGEMRPTDWAALRVGYRHDLEDSTADIYSIGVGFKLGDVFRFDLTGMVGSDNAVGGVLQTSYHF
jgi:hypothetical protein